MLNVERTLTRGCRQATKVTSERLQEAQIVVQKKLDQSTAAISALRSDVDSQALIVKSMNVTLVKAYTVITVYGSLKDIKHSTDTDIREEIWYAFSRRFSACLQRFGEVSA